MSNIIHVYNVTVRIVHVRTITAEYCSVLCVQENIEEHQLLIYNVRCYKFPLSSGDL